jgi:hypothetical protein
MAELYTVGFICWLILFTVRALQAGSFEYFVRGFVMAVGWPITLGWIIIRETTK